MTKFHRSTAYAIDTASNSRSRSPLFSSVPYPQDGTPPSGTSFLSKIFTNHQSRKTRQNDIKRATEITEQLQRIDAEKGDLLQRIVRNQLQLLRILALRNDYAKMITSSTSQSKRARSTIFKKVTEQFVNQYIDTYALENPDIAKKDLSNKKHEIEQILYDTFELNNAQRNQFILLFADYSRLYSERETILTFGRGGR